MTLKVLREIPEERRPQLLLRLNPMEIGTRFRRIARLWSGDLVVQYPEWEWDPDADWCCALPEDAALWYATVKHSIGNVSVASTVTLEFAAVGKPVVNLCFDAVDGVPAVESTRRFWDAGYYKTVRELQLARAAFEPCDLRSAVQGILERPGRTDCGNPNMVLDPVERVATEVAALGAGAQPIEDL